ncbi:MAG: peroxiredoxin family protein [Gemmataceae bacterium]|nr:peroxiredoxin family protein [Gemmataceae bacterium]MCI0740016.1 peroxiredoxin family protein [Gemmataceae bacterium]
MVHPLCLVTCVMALGQAPERSEFLLAPQLSVGLELVYQGVFVDEALVPNVQYQRQYRLETTLFVLESNRRTWEAAFLTSLSTHNEKNKKPDGKPDYESVRLEVVTIGETGKLVGPAGVSATIPIFGPPTVDYGAVVEAPLARVKRQSTWEVNEDSRPVRTWQVLGTEVCQGVVCTKLVGLQQSEDWDQPRADRKAWRRRDTVWLSPTLGVAQKVERVIEHRDPARRVPTHRTTAVYELHSPLKYTGRFFEDRRQEILMAKRFQDEAKPLLAQPSQYRGQIETLVRRVQFHQEQQAPTPYRKAVAYLENRLEAGLRGDFLTEVAVEQPAAPVAVALGQRVPDFVASSLTGKDSARLSRLNGRPLVICFFNPASATGKEVLAFAQEVHQKYAGKVGMLVLALGADPDFVRKQHADMKLPFPVHDGHGLKLTFGVDATPRLLVIDGDGVLRQAITGWGFHVPGEILGDLKRCLLK